jgi:hypothetical protein
MKRILKCGHLYWFPLDAPDIEQFFLVRLFRKLNLHYIPKWTIRRADQIFFREDKTKFKRKLIEYCKTQGIETYVVQEGCTEYAQNPYGCVPLKADYFLCPENMKDWWIEKGMPKDRIKTYHPESDNPKDYKGLVFMRPLYTRNDFLHPSWINGENTRTMRVLDDMLKENVVFSLHKKNIEIMTQFVPKHRIVSGTVRELSEKYQDIYCFDSSSVRKDLEMMGIKHTIL